MFLTQLIPWFGLDTGRPSTGRDLYTLYSTISSLSSMCTLFYTFYILYTFYTSFAKKHRCIEVIVTDGEFVINEPVFIKDDFLTIFRSSLSMFMMNKSALSLVQ